MSDKTPKLKINKVTFAPNNSRPTQLAIYNCCFFENGCKEEQVADLNKSKESREQEQMIDISNLIPSSVEMYFSYPVSI